MSRARSLENWNHTAQLLAEINRVAGNSKAKPEDFHPYAPRPKRVKPAKVSITALRDIFVKP